MELTTEKNSTISSYQQDIHKIMRENNGLGLAVAAIAISLLAVICGILEPILLPPRLPSHNEVTKARMTTLCVALLSYESDYGMFPNGSTSEVMKALYAPQQQWFVNGHLNVYFELKEPRKGFLGFNKYSPMLNGIGNYLDAWGTLFEIHFSEQDGIIIRSFGKNRIDDGGKLDDLALNHPFQ